MSNNTDSDNLSTISTYLSDFHSAKSNATLEKLL